MLKLIGLKKDVPLEIREAMAITTKNAIIAIEKLKEYFEEIVILRTCNRTEVYFNDSLEGKEGLKKVFEILKWDSELQEQTFVLKNEDVVKHLFEVVSGYHSKIVGEDQILAQIKEAYSLSLEYKAVASTMKRLFEDAISCGKKFRNESKLYEIPVSSASIAVNKAIELGAKSIMVMGYGMIGSLVVKYALGNDLEDIFIVVRDKCKVNDLNDSRVKVLNYDEYKEKINYVDAVISCTSAPHTIVKKEDINILGKNIALIDLALPRDIDKELKDLKRVILYDIDDISRLDSENKALRVARMEENKYIIYNYVDEFLNWKQVRNVSKYIIDFKNEGKKVVEDRVKSFEHKCMNDEDVNLASTLIKSTSDYYINRAIKVLKEEKLKGSEEQCLKILQKIFTVS